MTQVAPKTTALPVREAADKKRTITIKGIIIDIACIPAFLILFVIAMLYAGLLFVFRVK